MRSSIILLLILNFSVSSQKIYSQDTLEIESNSFNDSNYVLDNTFPRGDARRYGVTSKTAKLIHPYTGKNRLSTALDIAQKTQEEIYFPSGYYGMDLILDHRQNLKLRFDNSEFSLIHITQIHDSLPKPKNIIIRGNIIIYNRLGITEAVNIKIDSVHIKSNLSKSLTGLRSKGCHIYHGSKNIKIGYLQIDDFGSGEESYKYNHAALAIDGWNNNPINVQINKLHIKSTDRHGIYLTGRNHFIGEVIIDKYGVGDSEFMDPMQDAKAGEETNFKALWINKAYNSVIDKITIDEKKSKGKYSAHFDYGTINDPVIINNLNIINNHRDAKILIEESNGVLISK
jgi:hypothetical protein